VLKTQICVTRPQCVKPFRTSVHSDEQTFRAVAQWCCKVESGTYFVSTECQKGRCQLPRRPRSGSAAAGLLRLRVRIPPGGMNYRLLWVLCVVGWRSLRRADHSSREVLPSVVCSRRGLHEATSLATRQRVQSPASEQVASKVAMPITRKKWLGSQLVVLYFIIRHPREMTWRTAVFYYKVLAGRINYTDRIYKRDSILASEERVNMNRLQLHSLGFSRQRVKKWQLTRWRLACRVALCNPHLSVVTKLRKWGYDG